MICKYLKSALKITFLIFLISSCSKDETPISRILKKVEKEIPRDTINKFSSRQIEDRNHLDYFYLFKEEIINQLEYEKELEEFFATNGINKEVDKVAIIWKALHRKTNNQEIKFDSLLIESRTYRIEANKREKAFNDCKEKRKRIASDNFSKLEKGDLIKLSYPYYIGPNNHKNAFLYDCPSTYSNEDDNYVYLSGRVLDKSEFENYDKTNSLNVKMIVTEISDNSVPILMQWKRRDSIHEFDLESYGREIIMIKE